jgi:hypothetical protein
MLGLYIDESTEVSTWRMVSFYCLIMCCLQDVYEPDHDEDNDGDDACG